MPAWSPQQDAAILSVRAWLQNKTSPVFMLAGYAGTGKTTIAKELVSDVRGVVQFAAYTGKAAHVLRRRTGIDNVSTIHKLIYLPKEKCRAKLKQLEAERAALLAERAGGAVPTDARLAALDKAILEEKKNVTRPAWTLNTDSPLRSASLLVVDEYSMIDRQMGEDLLSFGVPILALGDPGQLPPVYGERFFGRRPDVMLTEIHRQAADNPIVHLSRRVREGYELGPGQYGTSRVVRLVDLPLDQLQGLVMGCDQLLVGRNATRITSNHRYRELAGLEGQLPVQGDKLVCLRNNHKIGILNGQNWYTEAVPVQDGDLLVLQLRSDDGERVTCLAHPNHFLGTVDKLDHWTRKDAEEFDFGYAITVHKAQGSEWDNVVLFDEWRQSNRKEWLYTAITRAAEKITIVQM